MAADADAPTQDLEATSRRRGIGLCLSGGGFRAALFHAGVIQRLFELGVAGREEFETVASVSGGSITAAQWAVAEAASADVGRRGRERELALGPGFRRGDVGGNLPIVGGVPAIDGGAATAAQSADVGRRGRERELALGPGFRRGDVGGNLPIVGGVPAIDGGAATAPSRDGAGAGVPSIDFVRDVVRPLLALTRRDIRTGAMAQKYLLPWNWFRGAFVANNMVEKFEGAFGKGTLDLLPERPRFVFCGTDMAFGATQGPKDR